MTTDGRDPSVLLSPEGVKLELPIAGPSPRILAYAIDMVLAFGLLLLLLISGLLTAPLLAWLRTRLQDVGSEITGDTPDAEALLVLAPLIVLFVLAITFVEVVYFTLFEFFTGGRSPGKWLVGLRVVSKDTGRAPSLRETLLRNVMRVVDVLPSSYATGLIAIVASVSGQRLGDRVAGTLVVRRDRMQAAPDIRVREGVEPLPLSREQAARLGPAELRLLRQGLRRLERLTGERRARLVQKLSDSIADRIGVEVGALDPDRERLIERAWLTAERALTRRR